MAKPVSFRINDALLPELRLLFENPPGGTLPNGKRDAGFNCYAKAFATVYLSRLQGISAELCEGSAMLAWVRPSPSSAYHIDPHAWAGLPGGGVVDLSINNFDGRKYFTVGHTPIRDAEPINARSTTSENEFRKALAQTKNLPLGVHLIYRPLVRHPFAFDALDHGVEAINSPPTRAHAARFPGINVLARAILHLHYLNRGERDPLSASTQAEAWDRLAEWSVDAMGELRRQWRAIDAPAQRLQVLSALG